MKSKTLPTVATLRQLLRYDEETGVLFWKARELLDGSTPRGTATFNARRAGMPAFTSTNSEGYLSGGILGVSVSAHRVIIAMSLGEWPEKLVDHINGDRTDNRLCNLRLVTPVENARNARTKNPNKWGERGISRNGQKWIVKVGGGRDNYIGTFETKEDAAAARKLVMSSLGYHPNHGMVGDAI